MIQINNLSKSFSDQILFENISFNIQKGERCGLVGRNGSGKSTLFSIIQGKLLPDSGEVSIPKNYRIGSLEQHIKFTKKTVLEECIQVLHEDQKYDFHLAEKILFGLGFTDDDLNKDPMSFSGGYQIRINLCKCLLIEPNLLLLDEPTNYLDIVSLRWLKSFLNSFQGEIILITHDRNFMDSITTHTMGITKNYLKKFSGDTAKFYEKIQLEDEIYQKTKENIDKKKAHLESFIDRFGAKASKASQAQSKMKQLNKLENMDDLVSEASMDLHFNYSPCPGKQIFEAKDLSFGFPGKDILFSNLNFSLGRNDKIGIIGKNGKGKSTLLNTISGHFTPLSGEVNFHPSTKIGHLGQTNIERLNPNNTIIEEIQGVNTNLGHTKVRNICGSLMFTGDMGKKKISVLSGGEKNRVMLGKIIANESNLLLLDEPTNHLDIESIEILSKEIKNYEGAVLIVTHSESLIRSVCNKLVIFHDNIAEIFDGSYDEFLEKIGWGDDDQQKKSKSQKEMLSKKEIHARRAVIIKERAKILNPILKKIAENENKIVLIEEKLEIENNIMSKAVSEQDNEKILTSSIEIGRLEKEISELFSILEADEVHSVEINKEFDSKLSELGE